MYAGQNDRRPGQRRKVAASANARPGREGEGEGEGFAPSSGFVGLTSLTKLAVGTKVETVAGERGTVVDSASGYYMLRLADGSIKHYRITLLRLFDVRHDEDTDASLSSDDGEEESGSGSEEESEEDEESDAEQDGKVRLASWA